MKQVWLFTSLLVLAACDFAPSYKPPEIAAPVAYKEAGEWVEATPADAAPRGAWWQMFHDPLLDALENQVSEANQSLKAAVAQYQQARATASQARAAYFPVVGANAGAQRQRVSQTTASHPATAVSNDFTFGADLSYEVDLWGRVRNAVAANQDQAEASAADLAGVALALHAELAINYFALRADDASIASLDKTVLAYQEAYDLTKRRFEGGVTSEVDVDQAQTQLENAKTQATDMRLQRSLLEHAIAILVGKAPATFGIVPMPSVAQMVPVNPGLPSTILQRRPDVAAAERRVAAANAEIGVARAAWFPVFNLASALGFESGSVGSWLNAPSRYWSFGASGALNVFNGGATSALNDVAQAAYEQTVAEYRQTVLVAYQEVEDNLAALHRLEQENKTQAKATAAARRALAQANERYKGGATTFLDVVVAQNNELQAQLNEINIHTRRMTANVQLVRALGGGWMPSEIQALEKAADAER